MSEKKPSEDNTAEDEIIYSGNSIPVFLRWIYVIFIIWAVSYFSKYLLVDLMHWF